MSEDPILAASYTGSPQTWDAGGGDVSSTPAGPWLDVALDRLSAKDRALLLGRYFEKRGFQDLARETGKSEPALRKQTERALGKLRTILKRRSVPLSTTVLAGLLGTELSSSAMPAAMAATVMTKVSPAVLSVLAPVSTLAKLMFLMSTWKATLTAAILLFLLLGTAAILELNHTARANESANLTHRLETIRKAPVARTFSPSSGPRPVKTAELPPGEDVLPDPLTGAAVITATWKIDGQGLWRPGYEFPRIQVKLKSLPKSEWKRLLREIDASPASATARRQAAEMVLLTLTSEDCVWTAEEQLRRKSAGLGASLIQWAVRDPDAAWAWLKHQLSQGSLARNGAGDTTNLISYARDAFARGLLLEREWPAVMDFVKNEKDSASRRMLAKKVRGVLKETDVPEASEKIAELLALEKQPANGLESSFEAPEVETGGSIP